jgi:hypothetical protein
MLEIQLPPILLLFSNSIAYDSFSAIKLFISFNTSS